MLAALAFLKVAWPIIEALLTAGETISPLIQQAVGHATATALASSDPVSPATQAAYDAALAEAQALHAKVQAA
jgi:hypothetical protein